MVEHVWMMTMVETWNIMERVWDASLQASKCPEGKNRGECGVGDCFNDIFGFI